MDSGGGGAEQSWTVEHPVAESGAAMAGAGAVSARGEPCCE